MVDTKDRVIFTLKPSVKKKKIPPYKFVGKRSFREIFGDTIPKELFPNKIMGTIIGVIFFLVVVWALIQFIIDIQVFSLGTFVVRDFNITIGVGIPLPFLEFQLQNPGASPLRKKGLLIDIPLYILIAYFINVMINLILKNMFSNKPEERKKYPRVYKNLEADKKVANPPLH